MRKSDAGEIIPLLEELRKQYYTLGQNMVFEKNITILQARCLYRISKNSPSNMNILKKELAVTGACVTNIVDELVRKKFVSRERDRRDRRIIDVFITENGLRCIREMNCTQSRFIKSLIKIIGAKEIKVVKYGLSVLVFSLRKLFTANEYRLVRVGSKK
ncbi:MAG: winged helix-turn-helix transcriptional regulator [Candidatus Omnitrophica bacterium]|nr:winged helix-turn-helix transcriptional regulator [Candidatus Omnitrophota bacterium]